jgi:hypothetical protein
VVGYDHIMCLFYHKTPLSTTSFEGLLRRNWGLIYSHLDALFPVCSSPWKRVKRLLTKRGDCL